jgi:hypothetical protein
MMGEFDDEIERMMGNVIPFEPKPTPTVSTESPVDTPAPIAVLDDERQRRAPPIPFSRMGVADNGPGLLCGTPLLEETPMYARGGGRGCSWRLTLLAYAFFGLGVSINVWNAPPPPDGLLFATMGVLAEGVMFWLPAHTLTLPPLRKMLAVALLAGLVVPFALVNSLRMASIVSADMAMARADRTSAAVRDAEGALDDARIARDKCKKNGPLCQQRQNQVIEAEHKLDAARAPVVAIARPESADFARLVTWATRGLVAPTADDFGMLRLLLRTLLPQVGGVVLLLARR